MEVSTSRRNVTDPSDPPSWKVLKVGNRWWRGTERSSSLHAKLLHNTSHSVNKTEGKENEAVS